MLAMIVFYRAVITITIIIINIIVIIIIIITRPKPARPGGIVGPRYR